MLELRLPTGVLPYMEVVVELILLTQSHQVKGTEPRKFSKKQQTLHQQTIENKQLKQKATLKNNYSSSQTAEFFPLHRVTRHHSTLQP